LRQPGHVGPSQPAALPLAYRFACVPSRMTVSSSVRVGRRCCHRILSIRGVAGGMANLKKHSQWPSWRCWRQVRRVFFVTLIPCALSHALCSACALVSAAVLGRLASLGFGMNILITRDIRMAPAGCAHECNRSPERMQPLRTRLESAAQDVEMQGIRVVADAAPLSLSFRAGRRRQRPSASPRWR